MGGGAWIPEIYVRTSTKAKGDSNAGFISCGLADEFDPVKIDMRESCRSDINENKDPISIVIGLDVTGSMGEIPKMLIRGHLGSLMNNFLKSQTEKENTQLMFAAIGDAPAGDRAPLQVTQFESDNRIEGQLQKLWLEGRGGSLGEESYNLLWYFAAVKTRLDSLNDNRKGVLITMGDERTYPKLTARDIRKVDSQYQGGDYYNQRLLEAVRQKYEVYHLIVADKKSSYYRLTGVDDFWHGLLGDKAIKVDSYEKISFVIMDIVDKHRPSKQAQANRTPFMYFRSRQSESQERQEPSNLPNNFYCPITHCLMRKPVVAADGHTYEEDAITEWFTRGNNTSPITGAMMENFDLRDNYAIKSLIEASIDAERKKGSIANMSP